MIGPHAREMVDFLLRNAPKLLAVSTVVFLLTLAVVYPVGSLVLAAICFGAVMSAANYVSWIATTRLQVVMLWGMVLLAGAVYVILTRYAFAENGDPVSVAQFGAIALVIYSGFLILLRSHLKRRCQ